MQRYERKRGKGGTKKPAKDGGIFVDTPLRTVGNGGGGNGDVRGGCSRINRTGTWRRHLNAAID